MRLLDNKTIDNIHGGDISFFRIDPEDYSATILEIIQSLSDFAWISKFDEDYMQKSFLKRAEETAAYLESKLKLNDDNSVTKDTGEYVVSELARKTIVSELDYLSVPLAELFKEQVSGNPGFDFYSASKNNIIVFGEAKYLSTQNAYGRGMEQVDRFIVQGQDISDLNDIDKFFDSKALSNATNGIKAYAVAFSSKRTSTDRIIKGIIGNKHFDNLSKQTELIFVAVDI